MNTSHEPAPAPRSGSDDQGRYDTTAVLTVPNALTVARVLGSGVMLWLAGAGHSRSFIALVAALLLTDWLDGKIAVWLRQRTLLGARLDSIADAVFYACLLAGTVWLRPDFMRSETILIAVMLGAYALSVIIALVRFGKLPAYHTRAAKTCWLLATIGAITLLAGGPSWPARIVLICVIAANIEAVAISFVLHQWQADVPSILHAIRRAKKRE